MSPSIGAVRGPIVPATRPRSPDVEVKKAVFQRADGGDFGTPLARDRVKLALVVPRGAVPHAKVSVMSGSRGDVPVRDVVVTVSLKRPGGSARPGATETVKLDVPLQLGRGRHRLIVQTDDRPPTVLHQHLFNSGPSR